MYDLYTAIARPLCLSGKIIVPPSSSMQSIIYGPLYGYYTAFLEEYLDHFEFNAVDIRPLYGHYTAVISINLICISKGMLEKFQDLRVCSHLN